MQGVVLVPQNLQTGSTPPHKNIDTNENMDLTTEPNIIVTKEVNQSVRSDSGFLSGTINTTYPEDRTRLNENGDSDNRSDCSTPDRKFLCPICEMMLTSQHEFTLHIRSHNNNDAELQEKGFVCKICSKVLSSSSSLDRHVLVHSGERPFTCKYCRDTFTTNGNMHRHMRTHTFKNDYESDGSSDSSSSSKNIEFNNNKVEKKRKLETTDEYKHVKVKIENVGNENNLYKCPVCERDDFNSIQTLELHLEDNHPDYPVKCHFCNQTFANNKHLNLHKNTVHAEENGKLKVEKVGFKDLTFVDFSMKKFPEIARHECEKNLHKASTGLKFQCTKCSRAFPCANSLQIHQNECCNDVVIKENLFDPNKSKLTDGDIRRVDFFSRLDLQDNSPEKTKPLETKLQQRLLETIKSIDSSKDLADIPSIISMTTNGTLLQYLHSKSELNPMPQFNNNHENQPEKSEEEEAQDIFAVEFRKMKLRGEFPCRLCTAVFPNLRALKGHNRAHLNGNNNGTYRCNMCPHSSIDKAALIRHMRTHNGDRPYECSLCNYAFTTKANCERHLRNRHAKTTREEVKKSIIYHPSEDPTNDDINKLGAREETKKLNMSSGSIDSNDLTPEKISSSTPKNITPEVKLESTPVLQYQPIKNNHSINDIIQNENIKTLKEHGLKSELFPFIQPAFFAQNVVNTSTPQKPKFHVKNFEEYGRHLSEEEDYKSSDYQSEEKPIDLSKKKTVEETVEQKDDVPQDLTKKAQNISNFNMFAHYPYHFDLLRNFPNWSSPFSINPLLFSTMQQSVFQQKQDIKRLQTLCGGVMINNLPYQPPLTNDFKPELKYPEPKFSKEEIKPLSLNIEPNHTDVSNIQSPITQTKSELIQSPNSVKMVIKNGVLMPKQKQRRYRTERPFSCEHCSARFTLRSNMERHIKQQHPQFWSQRQRSNIGNPTRKTHATSTGLNIPNYDAPKIGQDYEIKDNHISEKLKCAILAQHLRASSQDYKKFSLGKKEDEEDFQLIIDENEEKAENKSKVHDDKSTRSNFPKLESLLPVRIGKSEETQDLVPVSRLLDNASRQPFKEYFRREGEEHEGEGISEEDEEGLVASGSTSEANSGTDEKSESENTTGQGPVKKKSAYSLAPNRVSCPYCSRKFPWTSSLRRHILTHTGQKPFKCSHCPLLFTTKSNCDRHLLRKHGNSATTITNDSSNNNNVSNYLMRNVPERPFKCSNCPSSTFSTYSNLKKHMNCKHGARIDDKAQGYEAGSSEDEKQNLHDQKSEWEMQISHGKSSGENQNVQSNSDLPFKCHLCEGSFGDRQDCLDHIKEKHPSEYDLLMSKNALDNNASTPEETNNHDDEDNEIRGKFPDYSNRKVICAFCMRRFWSAEDLRRHMRTHTGERPFSCDICRRRFTLKHSMLRHRKKHNLTCESDHMNSDEDNVNPNLEKLKQSMAKIAEKTDESDCNEGNDLLGNLLGINDQQMIDQVLGATPDDAAKLLGVKNGN